MINHDRIVPIQKCDYLSMIGTMLAIANVSYAVAKSGDIEGNFEITGSGAAGNFLCDQPVKALNIASGVTGCTIYFVADYGFKGLTVNGAAPTYNAGSIDVDPDDVTLYKAVFASSKITISAVTPIAS